MKTLTLTEKQSALLERTLFGLLEVIEDDSAMDELGAPFPRQAPVRESETSKP